ncbi:MAG TPA: hypothetical protein VGR32_04525 [Brevundimonas sp.]|jgi:hypothetical protein|uniref:hypothetical protein n=1 Tax=Brevundimonas sp. TaxID=1871086 RepID=UPI002DEFC2B9|nr:hypothetical protein [Brevundimonas sp.]
MTQSDQAKAAAAAAVPRIDPATVPGWGVDADPDNDPTWPMRDRTRDDGPGMNWTPPETQTADVEILQSVEHQRRPASVGTTLPPRGLSGLMRRRAFRLSESQWGHWLMLMAADRVDTVEGLIDDVRGGRMPNPLVEMGLVPRARAREAAIGTLAAVVGVGVLIGYGLSRRRR